MRIVIIDKKRCIAPKCNYPCIHFCPLNKSGKIAIEISEDKKPIIHTNICIGCGICSKKCPVEAIKIVRLPEELKEDPIHSYGENAFRLYKLPIPRFGSVVGILGPNGIGKTTAIMILSGSLTPNLGKTHGEINKKDVIKRFEGTELQAYFEKLYNRGLKVSFKPQYVDQIPRKYKGKVSELIRDLDMDKFRRLLEKFGISYIMDRNIESLSGGELQKLAIAISLSKEYDILFLDEPCSYLDIRERIRMANIVRESLNEENSIIVVEHDLLILDLISDYIHIMYGVKGAYGVVSNIRGVRNGINDYLDGYLRDENIRFREEKITFEEKPQERVISENVIYSWEGFEVELGEFRLKSLGGEIHEGEIIGILGPNGIGKTTFAKTIAGEIKPKSGKISEKVRISYKPQFIVPEKDEKVVNILKTVSKEFGTDWYRQNIIRPLELKELFDKNLMELSGGELQRVAVAVCLSRDADLYLLDEPSAYLDVEQRVKLAKVIRRYIKQKRRAALVIDHDLLFIDYISDSIMVFEGEPGSFGIANSPTDLRDGLNKFLKYLGITVRRDLESRRPRINKPGSQKDKEQRERGIYYYI